MNTLYLVLAIVSFIGALIVWYFAISFWKDSKVLFSSGTKATICIILGFTLVLLGIASIYTRALRINFYKAIDAGYMIYIDGQEVEAEHLNLESYATYTGTHIDNDNQLILIDKR